MGVGENEGRQRDCTQLAAQIVEAFHELLPARTAEKRAAALAAASKSASKSAVHARTKQGGGKKDARKGKGKGKGAGNIDLDVAGKQAKGHQHGAMKQKAGK